jgi:hypothetical protein
MSASASLSSALDWPLIVRIAMAHGVRAGAIKKWRQRGVPYKWRLVIIAAAGAEGVEISPDDFEDQGGDGGGGKR